MPAINKGLSANNPVPVPGSTKGNRRGLKMLMMEALERVEGLI